MPKPRKGQTLTEKEEAFCREFVISWNRTRAALDAGYSRRTAASIGYENLKKPHIQARLTQLLEDKVMKREEVLARLSDQARATLFPFVRVDSDGFIYFNFADPDAQKHLHLIKKIKSKRLRFVKGRGEAAEDWEGEWVEVDLHDPQKALELIGRHQNLFRDTNFNIDVGKLTDDQLKRIAAGEDPMKVLANA